MLANTVGHLLAGATLALSAAAPSSDRQAVRWAIPAEVDALAGAGSFAEARQRLAAEIERCEAAARAADDCLELVLYAASPPLWNYRMGDALDAARKALELQLAVAPGEARSRALAHRRFGLALTAIEEWDAAAEQQVSALEWAEQHWSGAERWTFLSEAAWSLSQADRYAEAQAIAERLLGETIDATSADAQAATDGASYVLASIAAASGQFEFARRHFETSRTIREGLYGADSLEVVIIDAEIASLDNIMDQSVRAIDAYPGIIARLVALEGQVAREIEIQVRSEYADSLIRFGRDRDAEIQARLAFDRSLELYGFAGSLTVMSANALAATLMRLRRVDEAVSLFRQILALDPDGNPTGMNNLALALIESARYAEAEPLLRQALALLEERGLSASPDAATVNSNLANTLDFLGRADEAREYHERTVSLRSRLHGARSASLATALNNLASHLKDEGRLEQAEALYGEAIDIYSETIAPDHTFAIATLARGADLAARLADFGTARARYRKAQSGILTRLGRETGFSATARSDLDQFRAIFAGHVHADWELAQAQN